MSDIDSLLDSIFQNGKLNIRSTAEKKEPTKNVTASNALSDEDSAKTAIDKVSSANDEMAELLNRQLRDMDSLNKSVEAEIKGMETALANDGYLQTQNDSAILSTGKNSDNSLSDSDKQNTFTQNDEENASKKSDTSKGKAQNAITAFDGLGKTLNEEILGQEGYISTLTVAFKRPFVMGNTDDMPKNSILICGKRGTGRHSAVNAITGKLYERGALSSGEVTLIDLSLYPGQGESKLFLQDIYMALNDKVAVLAFDNYENCHPAFLAQLAELVTTGKIQLSQRYVLQKGILVEVGTALTPNAVSAIETNGQYLVFFSEKDKARVAGAFGAEFVNALGDICQTGKFDEDIINDIAKNSLASLVLKAKEKLNFNVTSTNRVPQFFCEQFDDENGIEAINSFSQICYRALSEYRLHLDSSGDVGVKLSIKDNAIFADFGAGAVNLISLLPTGFTGDLAAVKAQLGEIVGLAEIKDYILSLEENFKVQAMRKAQGLKIGALSMHMIFTGNPGTGKTTIARLVSQYLKAIGVLTGGQLVEVSRADLVGKYVGHTAPLTSNVVKSALGGVLFIDEAYSLFRGKDDSFGMEAIDTLVKAMEDNRDNLVVILAGYSDEMKQFLTANSGLRSRFPNIIEFPDYSAAELVSIAKITCKSKGYKLDGECEIPLLAYFDTVQKTDAKKAGNGRLVRNKIEAAILAQSRRVVKEKEPVLDLLTLADFDLEENL